MLNQSNAEPIWEESLLVEIRYFICMTNIIYSALFNTFV